MDHSTLVYFACSLGPGQDVAKIHERYLVKIFRRALTLVEDTRKTDGQQSTTSAKASRIRYPKRPYRCMMCEHFDYINLHSCLKDKNYPILAYNTF